MSKINKPGWYLLAGRKDNDIQHSLNGVYESSNLELVNVFVALPYNFANTNNDQYNFTDISVEDISLGNTNTTYFYENQNFRQKSV